MGCPGFPRGGTGDTPKADPQMWQAAAGIAEDWIYVLGPEDRLVDPQGRPLSCNGTALVYHALGATDWPSHLQEFYMLFIDLICGK